MGSEAYSNVHSVLIALSASLPAPASDLANSWHRLEK